MWGMKMNVNRSVEWEWNGKSLVVGDEGQNGMGMI